MPTGDGGVFSGQQHPAIEMTAAISKKIRNTLLIINLSNYELNIRQNSKIASKGD